MQCCATPACPELPIAAPPLTIVVSHQPSARYVNIAGAAPVLLIQGQRRRLIKRLHSCIREFLKIYVSTFNMAESFYWDPATVV